MKDTRTYPITVELPQSGRIATITRRPKIRDSRIGMRALGDNTEVVAISCAAMSQYVLLDGQPAPWEDFDDLDEDDFTTLQKALKATGDDLKNSQAAPPLQPLSNGASVPPNSTK